MLALLIERLRKRSTEIGDCWEWFGSMQSGGKTPAMNWQGHVKPVRRHIAETMGMELTGKLVTCLCRNHLCVNPDHVVAMTRKRLQGLTAKEQRYGDTVTRVKKISDKARARSRLTLEIVQQIRDAEGVQDDIAARFGVSQATVSSIKRGHTWRDYNNPFAGLIGKIK